VVKLKFDCIAVGVIAMTTANNGYVGLPIMTQMQCQRIPNIHQFTCDFVLAWTYLITIKML